MDLDQIVHLGVNMLRIQSSGEVQIRGGSEGGPVGVEQLVVCQHGGCPPPILLLEYKVR